MVAKEKQYEATCKVVPETFSNSKGFAGMWAYGWMSVFTLGLLPAYDIAKAAAGKGNVDSTSCQNTQLISENTIERGTEARGDFTGRILVVPVNFSEFVTEQSFNGRVRDVSLRLGRPDSEYAVHVKGSYKSENVQCEVDLQRLVKHE